MLLDEKEKWGAIYPNGSSNGAMNLVIDKKADFTIGKFGMTSLRNAYMTPSISYYSSQLIIIVPEGEAFTPLERLMKPFRVYIWSFVLAILAITFLVITFIRLKCDKRAQNFVFGAENSTPNLNSWNIFLGGSLHRLPKRNFARTLLCFFIIYCFILRNAYMGALFTFIKSDELVKPPANSIDEMVEKDFKFYMTPSVVELISSIPKIFDRQLIISPAEVQAIRVNMTNPLFKGGVLSSMDQTVYFNMINKRNFTLNVCAENLYTIQYPIYFQKNSHLVHRFNKELQLIQANGLTDKVVNFYIQLNFLVPKKSARSPKALELHQVMGCIKILIFGLLVAALVAILETLSRKVSLLRSLFKVV